MKQLKIFFIRLLLTLGLMEPVPPKDPEPKIKVSPPIEPPPRIGLRTKVPDYSMTLEGIMRSQSRLMEDRIVRYMHEILGQREEILRAFIAKYGCQPDEVEQITSTGYRYSDDANLVRWEVRMKYTAPQVEVAGAPTGTAAPSNWSWIPDPEEG